uniref:Putative secreted protein salivary gland overexpressed n=1 Tax=Rhipicephalus microplus TaxID=6941 RepID=A0A6M2DA99_RHIMP
MFCFFFFFFSGNCHWWFIYLIQLKFTQCNKSEIQYIENDGIPLGLHDWSPLVRCAVDPESAHPKKGPSRCLNKVFQHPRVRGPIRQVEDNQSQHEFSWSREACLATKL